MGTDGIIYNQKVSGWRNLNVRACDMLHDHHHEVICYVHSKLWTVADLHFLLKRKKAFLNKLNADNKMLWPMILLYSSHLSIAFSQ